LRIREIAPSPPAAALIEQFEESLNGTARLFSGRRSALDDFDLEDVWSMIEVADD
jgi:hypothetical protein